MNRNVLHIIRVSFHLTCFDGLITARYICVNKPSPTNKVKKINSDFANQPPRIYSQNCEPLKYKGVE